MFFDRLFGNVFGYIWLLILVVGIIALFLWVLLKKEDKTSVLEEKEEVVVEEVVEDKKNIMVEETKKDSEYEIIVGEDGFFRVRKVGSERTLRKFATRIEAENFIDKKGIK